MVSQCMLLGALASTEQELTADAFKRAIQSERCDMHVVHAVRRLPEAQRLPAAAAMAQANSEPMRYHALSMLTTYPPESAADHIRPLLKDSYVKTRLEAAQYLANKADDEAAREFLLKQLASEDAETRAVAARLLPGLKGVDAASQLQRLLSDGDQPLPVLLAAMQAAALAKAEPCLPQLATYLSDLRPRQEHARDQARVCDVAGYAIESILDIHHLPLGGYFSASVDERDAALATWQAWFDDQRREPDPHPRTTHADQVLQETLATLAEASPPEAREAARQRLMLATRTDFCLGHLPAIDRLLTPSVRDQWRIMQVAGEERWVNYVQHWRELDRAFEREFLKRDDLPAEPSQQAAAFIVFANSTRMPKVWIWSFCRDYDELFRGTPTTVAQVRQELEEQWKSEHKQVVLHGRIAVVEPVPQPRQEGNMVAPGIYALYDKLVENPSNWGMHRAAIDWFSRQSNPQGAYWLFDQQSKLYPGNEIVYLAQAAYSARVTEQMTEAIRFARLALILNPDNPKCHAIMGMILLSSDRERTEAQTHLREACSRDPRSLEREAETFAAIVCLVEGAMADNENSRAAEYLKQMTEFKAFGDETPFSQTKDYARLLVELNR